MPSCVVEKWPLNSNKQITPDAKGNIGVGYTWDDASKYCGELVANPYPGTRNLSYYEDPTNTSSKKYTIPGYAIPGYQIPALMYSQSDCSSKCTNGDCTWYHNNLDSAKCSVHTIRVGGSSNATASSTGYARLRTDFTSG